MRAAILIGWVLLGLAVAAQVRARRIPPPAPLADRVEVRVTRGPDAVEVELRGARGLALSFHQARWSLPVLSASGPFTLVSRRDVRCYRLPPEATGLAELRGVWEQLTFQETTLSVDLASASPPTAAGDLAPRRPAGPAVPARSRERPPGRGWPPRNAG